MTETMNRPSTETELPRWDLESVFPNVDDPAFRDARDHLFADLAALTERLDTLQINRRDEPPLLETDGAAFDEIIDRLNALLERHNLMLAFLYGHVTANTQDTRAQAQLSDYEERSTVLAQLTPRVTAWLGTIDQGALREQAIAAKNYGHMLRMAKIDAARQLTPPEEDLLAALRPSATAAWEKLHTDITAGLMVPFARRADETPEPLPMSAIRNLAFDADRDVRRRAFEAELTTWKTVEIPIAAALNGIKGHVNVVSRRRGWADPLDEALHVNRINQPILDALTSATEAAFPTMRAYLHAKAKLLGVDRIAWYDIFAPVDRGDPAESTSRWSWENGTAFVVEHFGGYSPEMRALAERALAERWIDAGSRPGKVDGAYCMPLRGDESRILANYQAAYQGASTLAHELGHAYHNSTQRDLPMLRRGEPNTLAETASTFCETIIRYRALATVGEQEQLSILESFLQGTTQSMIDIPSRFRFEQRVFLDRRERQLDPAELSELMLQAQRETYGDGLDQSHLHPHMWAVKSHYYSTGSYYNFPYLFGFLFGLGLYARYEQDPENFPGRYDHLLATTGQATASDLAHEFDIDLSDPTFWEGSVNVVRRDVERFQRLAQSHSEIDGK